MSKQAVEALIKQIEATEGAVADERVKAIVNRIVRDLFNTIDEFDVTPSEFWTALNFLGSGAPEFGLIAAGLGFERLLDIRMDEAEAAAGLSPNATPRTIEGPLYVAGAPESVGFARLCGDDEIGEPMIMEGQVFSEDGVTPLANALVEVWHANHLGNYSYFDRRNRLSTCVAVSGPMKTAVTVSRASCRLVTVCPPTVQPTRF